MATTRGATGGASQLPAARQRDRELRRRAQEALCREARLGDCRIDGEGEEREGGARAAAVLFPEGYAGFIDVSVEGGVVSLRGRLASREQSWIARCVCEAVPGCRAVENGLVVAEERGTAPPAARMH